MLAVKPSGPRFHRSFVALFPGLPAGPLAAWPAGLPERSPSCPASTTRSAACADTARRRGGSDGTPARSRRRSTPIGITFTGDGDGRPATTSHRPLILREERPAQRRQPPQRLALRRVQPLRQHQRTTPDAAPVIPVQSSSALGRPAIRDRSRRRGFRPATRSGCLRQPSGTCPHGTAPAATSRRTHAHKAATHTPRSRPAPHTVIAWRCSGMEQILSARPRVTVQDL